jgi:tRNA A-37 threonylcarbamoyl transferase component Bud32
MVIGPIHGDLHAQNILVDADGTIHLIDFAWSCENWKAIDFLMLECSLKFLVAPMNARQRDLLVLEELIDFGIPDGACIKHDAHIYGHELKTITAAINKIRRICEEREYIANHADYLRGLVALTGCLASLPLLNRRFLINSLAYNMRKLKELG